LFRTCTRVGVIVDRRMITDTLDGILANPHPWILEYFHSPRARGAEMAERPGEHERGAQVDHG
jgi:phospholipid/cholesterol/gamma-HCH transport system ATP-binding protein